MLFEHFWVETGAQPLPEPTDRPHFVMTPSVRGHLRNLARAALVRRFPILLQARLNHSHTVSFLFKRRCSSASWCQAVLNLIACAMAAEHCMQR